MVFNDIDVEGAGGLVIMGYEAVLDTTNKRPSKPAHGSAYTPQPLGSGGQRMRFHMSDMSFWLIHVRGALSTSAAAAV